jgi:hypothetical protein
VGALRLVIDGREVAFDLAAVDGLAGADFFPSHENLLVEAGDFLPLFAAERLAVFPLVAAAPLRALVADDSVLMLGPRFTRLV